MRWISIVLIAWICSCTKLQAQPSTVSVKALSLPDSMQPGYREFSGLARHEKHVFFLAENRGSTVSGPTTGIYSIPAKAIRIALRKNKALSRFHQYNIEGLATLKQKTPCFEGIEALCFMGNTFFISIETNNQDSVCRLAKGVFTKNRFIIDTSRLIALPKPKAPDGSRIHNAGFEALLPLNGKLYAFFESNYWGNNRHAYCIDTSFTQPPQTVPMADKIPFRLTDATAFGKNRLLAINYAWKGEAEKYFRPDSLDADHRLMYDGSQYHNYGRLLQMEWKQGGFSTKQKIELPALWRTSNWEGLTKFGKGVLMINDCWGLGEKKHTELIFIHLKE